MLGASGPLHGLGGTPVGRAMTLALVVACLTWIGALALLLLQPDRTVGALIGRVLRWDRNRLGPWAVAWVVCFCSWVAATGTFTLLLILSLS